ncbi:hypothetical protein [Natronococcus roseus]|uniref:hypothetical protein n=1 Tax=Natronococcus roseus TaxID=1052014 RepID=UPI00374D245B
MTDRTSDTTVDAVRRYSDVAEDLDDDEVEEFIDDAETEALLHNDEDDFQNDVHLDLLVRYQAAYMIDSRPEQAVESLEQQSRSVDFDTERDLSELVSKIKKYDPSGEMVPGLNRISAGVVGTGAIGE